MEGIQNLLGWLYWHLIMKTPERFDLLSVWPQWIIVAAIRHANPPPSLQEQTP